MIIILGNKLINKNFMKKKLVLISCIAFGLTAVAQDNMQQNPSQNVPQQNPHEQFQNPPSQSTTTPQVNPGQTNTMSQGKQSEINYQLFQERKKLLLILHFQTAQKSAPTEW